MAKLKPGWILGIGSVSLAFLLLLPLLWYGLGADQGWFSYSAWVWRKFGLVPYRDLFEQNFPGIFFIHYFVQATLGESITAFRVFDLAWQTATAGMIYLVAVSIFQNRLSGFLAATLYPIYYLGLGPWHTGQRDEFFLLCYLLSFRLFMRGQEGRDIPRAAAAGLLIGFACLVKPVAALAGMVLLALVIKRTRAKIWPALAFLAAGSIPALAAVFYFQAECALHALYECIFLFTGKVYLDYGTIEPLKLIVNIFMTHTLKYNVLILIGAAIAFARSRRIPQEKKSDFFWFALVLIASYAGYLAQGKYAFSFYYHEAPVLGALCLFAGRGWAMVFAAVNRKWTILPKTKTALLSCVLIGGSFGLMNSDYRGLLKEALRLPPGRGQDKYLYQQVCREAADYVRLHSGSEDKLQVWGGEAIINFLAQRRAPSRFAYSLQLIPLRPGRGLSPMQKGLGEELLSEMKKDPPLFFIMARLPYFQNADISKVLIEDYPQMRDFLEANYVHVQTINRFEIYRLNK